MSASEVLTHEHHQVDEALEGFLTDLANDRFVTGAVLAALGELRRHIYSEEEFLFPPLSTGGMVMPIGVMVREHGALWRLMDELEPLLAEDSPSNRQRSEELVRDLLSQLEGHNFKEERIVYTAAETMLTDEQKDLLNQSLDLDALPAGWVCRNA